MEHELDKGFTIEPWLSQIIRESHDLKFDNVVDKFKRLANRIIGENFCENFMKYVMKDINSLLSGSAAEGSAFVRNLNPSFENNKMEQEVDIMNLLAKILKNRSREVIVDLTYAKGFAWIRYEPECFGLTSEKKLKEFFIQHVDGNIYLNSKAIKVTSSSMHFPDLFMSGKVEPKGPSNNFELKTSNLEIPSKDLLDEVSQIFDECVQFIKRAHEQLKQFHDSYLTELEILKKTIQDIPELINVTDFEEVASVVLPRNKERKNIFLQIYWQLLAFINEVLFTIHTIEKMKKRFSPEKLGIYAGFLMSPCCSISTKNISESLNEYFKYLLNIFPGEVLQKYRKLPSDGLSYFILKCKQDKASDVFRALIDFENKLSFACGLLKVEPDDQKDNPEHLGEYCGSLDLVPAIEVEDWPSIADEWQKRYRQWPPRSLVEEVIMKGCHIVPKPYFGQERNELLDWRWSFSPAEKILAANRTKEMDVSYFVLKSVFYRYLKPIEHNGKTLFSYLIKTVILWQCEEHDEKWWSNESIMSCIFALLDRLKICFSNKCLPHYFIRDINLFDNVAEELVLYGQAVLESICADPAICIREVLEKYFGKAPRHKKENKKSEPELMPDLPEMIEIFLNGIRQMIKENSFISKSVFIKALMKILEGLSNEDHVSIAASEDHISFGSENMISLMETVADEIFYSMSLAKDLTANISELNTEDITLD